MDAFECLKNEKNIKLFTELGIFSTNEIASRYEISLESYCKKVLVEALTAIKMINNQIYPSSLEYLKEISQTAINLKAINANNLYIIKDIKNINGLLADIKQSCTQLEEYVSLAKANKELYSKARFIKDKILSELKTLRSLVDIVETKVDKKYWPMPTYEDLLFSL